MPRHTSQSIKDLILNDWGILVRASSHITFRIIEQQPLLLLQRPFLKLFGKCLSQVARVHLLKLARDSRVTIPP